MRAAAQAAAEVYWEAGAAERAYKAAKAVVQVQEELLAAIAYAEEAAEIKGKVVESVVNRAARAASKRATEHIARERKAREELMSLASCVQADGSLNGGGHSPVKPPLPRTRTVPRSHVYGETPTVEVLSSWWAPWWGGSSSSSSTAVAPSESVGSTPPTQRQGSQRYGRFAGVDGVRLPSPSSSTLERLNALEAKLATERSSLGSTTSGLGRPSTQPRDVNNIYPHATVLDVERGPFPYDGYEEV